MCVPICTRVHTTCRMRVSLAVRRESHWLTSDASRCVRVALCVSCAFRLIGSRSAVRATLIYLPPSFLCIARVGVFNIIHPLRWYREMCEARMWLDSREYRRLGLSDSAFSSVDMESVEKSAFESRFKSIRVILIASAAMFALSGDSSDT